LTRDLKGCEVSLQTPPQNVKSPRAARNVQRLLGFVEQDPLAARARLLEDINRLGPLLDRGGFSSWEQYKASPIAQRCTEAVLARDEGVCQSCMKPATKVAHLRITEVTLYGRPHGSALDFSNAVVSVCDACAKGLSFTERKALLQEQPPLF
jgi:hypothetical protein